MDWQLVRSMVYGRLEGELQKQIQLAEENPADYEDMTPEEMADQILEIVGTE